MSYVVPNFNLLCNIGQSPTGPLVWPPLPYVGLPRIALQPCALVFGRRVNVSSTGGTGIQGVPIVAMSLLVPAGTDIRAAQSVGGRTDVVEVPAGSGRWYGVANVDDIGKGYANEHRTACILAIQGTWVVPYA